MMRLLVFLLLFILVVPLIRIFVGAAARALSDFLGRGDGRKRPEIGGKLHRDPVCGVYVSEQASVKRVKDGETRYYCSEECARKDERA
jgi:YHS domain-containing protein